MTTTDTIASLALCVAIVAAVAAIGSWKAARNSNGAAQTMSRIEQQRLHADLTPVFRCAVVANEARSTAMLRVHLEGPPGLLSHDAIQITVSIRNDNPHRGNGPQLAGTAAPEQVRAHIWGPWKFSADGRDDTGRTVAPQQLTVGEWTRYGLTPTTLPPRPPGPGRPRRRPRPQRDPPLTCKQ
ncbi:hypothetical protein [Streptomyces angustmyceticus]|uniref:hypothetical protein n=1 Tax=Streptomyces angustmyceticus TaxID=285578 RepID=UPI003D94B2D0